MNRDEILAELARLHGIQNALEMIPSHLRKESERTALRDARREIRRLEREFSARFQKMLF